MVAKKISPNHAMELMVTNPNVQTLAQRFANWALFLEDSQIPQDVRTAAHRAILDTIGVCVAGSIHPKVHALCTAFCDQVGSAHVIGQSNGFSAATAALINGMSSHVWDYDDTSYTGIMHGSIVILPAVLAVAETEGVSHEAILPAFVVGSEIAYALAEACGHSQYFRGWWSTGVFALIGAVAAVCRLRELSVDQTASAIGMAAASVGVGRSILGTDAKPFFAGEAAQRAVTLTQAAAAGLTGPIDVFENDHGFIHLLNNDFCDLSHIEALGRRWRLTTPGLLFKKYPVCSAAHAAIELTTTLMNSVQANAADIQSIKAEVSELVYKSLVYHNPKTPQEAQFSLQYALACASIHGDFRLDDLDADQIDLPEKQLVMQKIVMSIASDLSTDAMRSVAPESTRLVITLNDGQKLEGECLQAYGMPERPLTDEDLLKKFRNCLDFAGIPGQKYCFETKDYIHLVRDLSKNKENTKLNPTEDIS